MILQILFLVPREVVACIQVGRVPVMFINSGGVDVVVVRQQGEVLRVQDGIAVSVLSPHGLMAGEASPEFESILLVDDQFAPLMFAWQGDCFKIFDEPVPDDGLSPSDGLE